MSGLQSGCVGCVVRMILHVCGSGCVVFRRRGRRHGSAKNDLGSNQSMSPAASNWPPGAGAEETSSGLRCRAWMSPAARRPCPSSNARAGPACGSEPETHASPSRSRTGTCEREARRGFTVWVDESTFAIPARISSSTRRTMSATCGPGEPACSGVRRKLGSVVAARLKSTTATPIARTKPGSIAAERRARGSRGRVSHGVDRLRLSMRAPRNETSQVAGKRGGRPPSRWPPRPNAGRRGPRKRRTRPS